MLCGSSKRLWPLARNLFVMSASRRSYRNVNSKMMKFELLKRYIDPDCLIKASIDRRYIRRPRVLQSISFAVGNSATARANWPNVERSIFRCFFSQLDVVRKPGVRSLRLSAEPTECFVLACCCAWRLFAITAPAMECSASSI